MSELFDYFAHVDLPTPTVGVEEVERLCSQTFGLTVAARPLGSQQDQNFRLFRRGSDEVVGVLKLSNPVFSELEIEMQDLAAQAVARADSSVRVPCIVVGPRGPMRAWWETSEGPIHARVLENISGQTLTGSRYLSPRVIERLGDLAGRVSVALAGFTHPASGRILQWDLRHARRVIETLLPQEPDAGLRAVIERAVDGVATQLDAVADRLPMQAGHFDITDDNVLRREDRDLPDAVIDFGDILRSWRVAEIAVTVSSVLHHDGADPLSTIPAIRAFHARRPLTGDEITALWPLVVLRGATLVLSGRAQVRLDAGNDYAARALDREFRVFDRATSVPASVMTEAIRMALHPSDPLPPRAWPGAPLLPLPSETVILDAGTVSALNDEGGWLHGGTLQRAALAALDGGAPMVALPAWQAIATGAPQRTPSAPETVPTGATVWLAEPQRVTRQDGEVTVGDGILTWMSGDEVVTVAGLPEDEASDLLPARTPLFVQRRSAAGDRPPAMVVATLAPAWRALTGDPAAALGMTAAAARDDDMLGRRHRVLAEVQEHYYAAPPRIERGWREYLLDLDGRVYLDMVNNVASVGHAHPKVVAAATRQANLLNTNSRFHYGVITEYAERLVGTLPAELDTVFLVNSGSEATDLAIRLAMATTGRSDIVAMREAYHGWTFASDAVSTSLADNPNAVSTRPAWVHTVAAANSYRGDHRGPDAWQYGPEAVSTIDELAESGQPPAGIICEPFFGNAGGVALPDGYLRQVYDAIRRHGGVAIADEVQVGFGRLGEWFWGFQQQGVVPDIVAVAKSIGGGHPLGAVITRREIADRYRSQGYFFSSTGGAPVSAAIGLAVLEVIEEEGLQENARVVGSYLKQRLERLGDTYPIVGTVHGSGLYLGLEFVRDRGTFEPATEETAGICDRLLTLGVIMQPTGDHQNVLKIKPPLCISRESADYFVDALDRVLRTGW